MHCFRARLNNAVVPWLFDPVIFSTENRLEAHGSAIDGFRPALSNMLCLVSQYFLSSSRASSLREKVKNLSLFALIALLVIALSQAIGYWVDANIAINSTVEINSLIHLTHVRNFGGVFGMLQGKGWLFGLVSIGLLVSVTAYLWFSDAVKRYEFVCFGFIVGGGTSNIVDRLIHGSVIDFIDIQHIPYWNYVFNTADVMVHVGIWPLLFFSLFLDKEESGPT